MRYIFAAVALAFAAPAFAQSSDAPLPDPNDQSDSFTIGVGGGDQPVVVRTLIIGDQRAADPDREAVALVVGIGQGSITRLGESGRGKG